MYFFLRIVRGNIVPLQIKVIYVEPVMENMHDLPDEDYFPINLVFYNAFKTRFEINHS
jgi:hypothetical protein